MAAKPKPSSSHPGVVVGIPAGALQAERPVLQGTGPVGGGWGARCGQRSGGAAGVIGCHDRAAPNCPATSDRLCPGGCLDFLYARPHKDGLPSTYGTYHQHRAGNEPGRKARVGPDLRQVREGSTTSCGCAAVAAALPLNTCHLGHVGPSGCRPTLREAGVLCGPLVILQLCSCSQPASLQASTARTCSRLSPPSVFQIGRWDRPWTLSS